MSFDIDWTKLDKDLGNHVQSFLNRYFSSLSSKPDFIGSLTVTSFEFGTVPPEITIIDFTDPWLEFYAPDEEEESDDLDDPELAVPGFVNNQSSSLHHGGISSNSTLFTQIGSHQHSYFQQSQHQQQYQHLPPRLPNRMHSTRHIPITSTPRPFTPGHHLPNPLTRFHTPETRSEYSHNSILHASSSSSLSSMTSSTVTTGQVPNSTTSRPKPNTTGTTGATALPLASGVNNPREEMLLRAMESKRGEYDSQILLDVYYKGDVTIQIQTEIVLNMPTPQFMVLPVCVTVRSLTLSAQVVLAFLQMERKLCFSLLEGKKSIREEEEEVVVEEGEVNEDEDQEEEEKKKGKGEDDGVRIITGSTSTESKMGPPVGHSSTWGKSLLKDITIESEIGDKEKQILRNVGKVEKFIVDQIRRVLVEYLLWPNYHVVDLDDEGLLERTNGGGNGGGTRNGGGEGGGYGYADFDLEDIDTFERQST